MLILVRHGRTEANASGLLVGSRVDVDLDDVGRTQAEAVGSALSNPARVVSSPLLRARQTAAAISRHVTVDERWSEIDYGSLDGQPIADVPAALWAEWRSDPETVIGGGESIADVGRRVRAACTDLAQAAAHEDIVVVTHVSPIKAALAWALGVGDDIAFRSFCANGSLTQIRTATDRPTLVCFNSTGHLPAG